MSKLGVCFWIFPTHAFLPPAASLLPSEAPLPLFKHARLLPVSGPWPSLFPLPGMPFPASFVGQFVIAYLCCSSMLCSMDVCGKNDPFTFTVVVWGAVGTPKLGNLKLGGRSASSDERRLVGADVLQSLKVGVKCPYPDSQVGMLCKPGQKWNQEWSVLTLQDRACPASALFRELTLWSPV